MIYSFGLRRLEFGVLFRVLLLFGTLCLAVYVWQQYTWLQVSSAALVILLQVWELGRYVTRSNRELARFLLAIKSRDFSQRFSEQNTSHELRELHQAFNQINSTFTQLHIEKELQFQYQQTILQLVDTGLIAFDETGEVEWMNEAFKRTLQVPYLKNIHALEQRNPALHQTITQLLKTQNQLVKLKVKDNPLQLLLSSASFKIEGRNMTLLAFKNVSNTLDQAETEAWQKLLRVMTHEIMNSVAPISSLADTMLRNLRMEKAKTPAEPASEIPHTELLSDTEEVLQVIQNRSEGLLRFAQVYRNLSKFTDIMLTTVYVQELFNSISGLLKPRLQQQGIKLLVQVPSAQLTIKADPHLLEQVLINLIINAERAVKGRPNATISLIAVTPENQPLQIEVADNGTGIPEEMLDSIFVPFFSGHKDGSGIGLTLAKQIMNLHRGSIQVKSKEGEGTVFTLQF